MTDKIRYIPQIRLSELGMHGQEKLLRSSILIVGCGALGSLAAMYLAGAGIGKISIADFDTVEISNLHRQIFYAESDAGHFKADILASKIHALNSEITCEVIKEFMSKPFLADKGSEFDMILDCADNPDTTYMLDEFCHEKSLPLSTAGISGWEALVYTFVPGKSRYSDLVPPPESKNGILPCSLNGVLGSLAGIAASFQSCEVIKTLTGLETGNTLYKINILTGDFRKFSV